MNVKRTQGFIFLMTLIFAAVISLLVLTSMQHILLYHKAINRHEVQQRHFYHLEEVAFDLVGATELSCFKSGKSANQIIHQLLHQEGCILKKGESRYRYVLEDLGEFPCLVVSYQGKKRATSHRRVSVVYLEDGSPSSLLQIRFIALGAKIPCFAQERSVNLGLSSWRYFAAVEEIF